MITGRVCGSVGSQCSVSAGSALGVMLYVPPWDKGTDVVIEGDAEQVTDDDQLRRLADAWATKWDGRWRYGVRDGAFHHQPGAALVFSVTPTKILAFGKGTFSHTRHRF